MFWFDEEMDQVGQEEMEQVNQEEMDLVLRPAAQCQRPRKNICLGSSLSNIYLSSLFPKSILCYVKSENKR